MGLLPRVSAGWLQGFGLVSSVAHIPLPSSLGAGRLHLAVTGLRSLLSCWLSVLRLSPERKATWLSPKLGSFVSQRPTESLIL